MCNCPQMVVLAVALFVTLSSCAVGCLGNINSLSMSFVHWCYKATRQMEHKSHTLCNKSFPFSQMLFRTDRTVLSFSHIELIKRIEHYIILKSITYLRSVTNSSCLTRFARQSWSFVAQKIHQWLRTSLAVFKMIWCTVGVTCN